MMKNKLLSLFFTLILVLICQEYAMATAGKFLFTNGDVSVVESSGKSHKGQKGDELNEGDSVVTSANGFAQIRMDDGGAISVRPDTNFKISKFQFDGKEDGSEKSHFSLLKGSIRSVTGIIGKKHRDNYKIETATATIGVRGSGADVGHADDIGTAVHTLFGRHILSTSLEGKTFVLETKPGQTALVAPGMPPQFVPNFPFSTVTSTNTNKAEEKSSDNTKQKSEKEEKAKDQKSANAKEEKAKDEKSANAKEEKAKDEKTSDSKDKASNSDNQKNNDSKNSETKSAGDPQKNENKSSENMTKADDKQASTVDNKSTTSDTKSQTNSNAAANVTENQSSSASSTSAQSNQNTNSAPNSTSNAVANSNSSQQTSVTSNTMSATTVSSSTQNNASINQTATTTSIFNTSIGSQATTSSVSNISNKDSTIMPASAVAQPVILNTMITAPVIPIQTQIMTTTSAVLSSTTATSNIVAATTAAATTTAATALSNVYGINASLVGGVGATAVLLPTITTTSLADLIVTNATNTLSSVISPAIQPNIDPGLSFYIGSTPVYMWAGSKPYSNSYITGRCDLCDLLLPYNTLSAGSSIDNQVTSVQVNPGTAVTLFQFNASDPPSVTSGNTQTINNSSNNLATAIVPVDANISSTNSTTTGVNSPGLSEFLVSGTAKAFSAVMIDNTSLQNLEANARNLGAYVSTSLTFTPPQEASLSEVFGTVRNPNVIYQDHINEFGGNLTAIVKWGRWTNYQLVTNFTGGSVTLTPTNSLHAIYASNTTTLSELSLLQYHFQLLSSANPIVDYSTLVLTNYPTNELGGIGTLNGASATVNFLNSSMSMALNGTDARGVNASNGLGSYIATANGPISNFMANGLPLNGSCSGGSCVGVNTAINGMIKGSLVGSTFNGTLAPPALISTYILGNQNGNTALGTVYLKINGTR